MAIATTTAIALAATAATTTGSFIQAGKQKDAQRQAERDADEAMAAARKKLEVNYYNQLSIKKEPYELEREALLSQGAQAIQAGVESERGAAATAGRVQMAQQEGQAGIRTAMGQELTGLEKLSAQEDSRLRDVGVQLDLNEVSGAQLAARNAAQMSAQAQQQGWQGVTSLGGQIAALPPLYGKTNTKVAPPPDVKIGALPPEMAAYAAQQNNAVIAPPSSSNPYQNTYPSNNIINQTPATPLFLQGQKQQQQNFRFYNPSTYQNPFGIY